VRLTNELRLHIPNINSKDPEVSFHNNSIILCKRYLF
jgi:hypothetical protein